MHISTILAGSLLTALPLAQADISGCGRYRQDTAAPYSNQIPTLTPKQVSMTTFFGCSGYKPYTSTVASSTACLPFTWNQPGNELFFFVGGGVKYCDLYAVDTCTGTALARVNTTTKLFPVLDMQGAKCTLY